MSSIKQPKPQVVTKPARFFSWWSTARGVKMSSFLMVGGSISAALYQVAPNTFMINFVRDFYQHSTRGRPTIINGGMKLILEGVDHDLRHMKPDQDNVSADGVEFFVSTCTDVCGWGEPGAMSIVGFPLNFMFRSKSDVPLERMQFGNLGAAEIKYLSEEELKSEQAKQLAESIVHSDDSKKFAIAREIIKIGSSQHFMQGGIGASFVLLTFFISKSVNRKLNLFRKAPLLRYISYPVISSAMLLYYFLVRDGLNRRLQRKVDEQTASISPAYARGGVEYYTKILQQNAVLRDLHLDGKNKWSMTGEDITEWIRNKNMCFTDRRAICLDALNEFAVIDALKLNSQTKEE